MSRDWWRAIQPFVRIEKYGNRKGEQSRIEVRREFVSVTALRELAALCPHCQQDFNPIRQREGFAPQPYVRVTCGGTTCTRSEEGRREYRLLVAYLRNGTTPGQDQGRLF